MKLPIADVQMNVLCNLLTNIVYLGYHKLKELKNKNNKEIQEISDRIQEFLVDYEDTPLDSASFCQYIRRPQVNDMLHDYVLYIATGLYKSNMQKLKEKTVLEYLAEYAAVYCRESVRGIDRNMARDFFSNFFKNCREYYFDKLSINQKTMVYIINERISRLETNIDSILKREVRSVPEYAQISDEYIRILKRSYQTCLIYGFAEVRLNQCYVLPELEVVSQAMSQVKYDDLVLWEDAGSGKTQLIEVLPPLRQRKKVKWNELFNKNNIVYLIGGAGYGKSLYLRYMINNFEQLNIGNAEDYLVLHCDLKSYYSNPSKQPYPLVDFLSDCSIENTGLDREKLSVQFIHYYLDLGRCIILFDALDEVPLQYRNKLHNLIISFFAENNQNNKICITSRSRGFIPKQEIEVYEIAPLTEKQISKYLNYMVKLRFFKKEDIPLFLEQAMELQDKDFLNSFLLLSLLVSIFRAEKKLPQTKVELYRKCFDYIARERELTKSEFDKKYDWGKISYLMKDSTFIELACMAAPNNRSIRESDIVERLSGLYEKRFGSYAEAEEAVTKFLDFCAERTELFVPAPEEKMYKFFHRSFFEYFYSRYICTNFNTSSKIYNEFHKFEVDTEIYELTVSIIKNDNERLYQDLVEYVFEKTEDALSRRKNIENNINLLISVLRTVDEKFYKERFVKLLIKHYDVIMDPPFSGSFSDFGMYLRRTSERGVIKDRDTFQAVITAALKDDEELTEEFSRCCVEDFCIWSFREIFVPVFLRIVSASLKEADGEELMSRIAVQFSINMDGIYNCLLDYDSLPDAMSQYVKSVDQNRFFMYKEGMRSELLETTELIRGYVEKMDASDWKRFFQYVKMIRQ